MLLLHLGVFQLDVDGERQTPWHLLIPKTRLLCVLMLVLAIVLTPHAHWWTWAWYGGVIAIGLLVSQITISVLLKRVAVELSFVAVILIGTLFREGGTILWQWGFLKITTTGLTILGSVTTKAFLSLLLLNMLTLTTSVPGLMRALADLKTPPLLVAILESMYRYMGVLIDEFNAMRRAALSRNLMSSRRWQRLVVGNMIGSLFIRTYDRGERVHRAMLSRGYAGLPSVRKMPKGGKRDILALILTTIVALAGQAIYLIQ